MRSHRTSPSEVKKLSFHPPGSLSVAMDSDKINANHLERLQSSASGAVSALALPGRIVAKLHAFAGGMRGEPLVVVFYGGLYRAVLHLVGQGLPRKVVEMEKEPDGTQNKRTKMAASREAELVYSKGMEYESAMDIQSAIACFERACDLQPKNITYLARLSKQWTDISFAPGVCSEKARELNLQAHQIAEKIARQDPEHVLGSIALCVSKGRLAYFSDNRAKVRLARDAEDVARKAVVLHPQSDLIHHLLGRWHYEMAGLSAFARTVVRLVYGTTLHPGSYQGALAEFQIAARLAPNRLIHHVELGKAHWRLGNREQAIEALERALQLEVIDINDYLELEEGNTLLKRIQGVQRTPWDFRLNRTPARPLFCE